jgi:glycosyltransferase involved in cell wall biosynthesis
MIKKTATSLLPAGSLRRKTVKKLLVSLHLRSNIIIGYYNTWAQQQREHPPIEKKADLSSSPLISIIVPAFNTPERYIDELIFSIISQSYENWELILINVSTDEKARARINLYSHKDKRIHIREHTNEGIAANTNVGISFSKGTYIAFIDHDDVIEPFALQQIVTRIVEEDAEVIYSDEDKISDNSEVFFDPHFKPSWSPDMLTHVNYINHLSVIKKDLILQAGLLDPSKDGAQDYDLMLRVTDLQPKIVHVPEVLYHWRAAQNSTAQDFSSKKNITYAGKLSLEEHFKRQGLKIEAIPKDRQPGFYALKFPEPNEVSLIITPFASDALIRLFTETLINRCDISNMNIQLVIPDGVQPRFKDDKINLKTIKYSGRGDYLEKALKSADYPESVIVNQIALPLSTSWLQRLCGPLCLGHVGAVSPLIVREGSIIDDCGIVINDKGQQLALFKDQAAFLNQTFFGNTDWVRNTDALSGQITAVHTNELIKFIESSDEQIEKTLTSFSLSNKLRHKYNLLFSEVVLDNYSIRLKSNDKNTQNTLFSPSLFASGRDYEPYTPESSAINILLKIVDHEENP